MTTPSISDLSALREVAEKATPGPWKAVSEPNFDNGLVYTSVQPVAVDEEAMKPMAMMNGEYHVCRMSHTAAEWRFSYHRANAAYIAAFNPQTVLALLDHLASEKARADAAEAAYRLERDQVVAALRAIESMCPATQEMTLAHAMADLARDTLTDIGAE